MASTTAFFTGLSGLNANARNIDVIGNNISNVNTTAFKSSRMLFKTQVSRTMGIGSSPNGVNGGTNPTQVGLGVGVAGTQRDFRTGTINPTGDSRDLAIEGNGFFIVESGDGISYTRAGAFRQDASSALTTIEGFRLKGYGVDDQFNIVKGELVDVSVPIGELTIAEQTRNVRLSGNLNADGPVASGGTLLELLGTPTTGFNTLAGTGSPANDTTLLTDIEDPDLPNSGVALFAAGQSIQLTGAEKGGSGLLPTEELAITAGTTVQELLTFLTGALGINTNAPNPNGTMPGATIDGATGVISLVGNAGTENDLIIEPDDLRLLDPDGSVAGLPFVTDKLASADGESVKTSFVVFDSLGTPVDVSVTMVLDGKSNAGTTWRYFIESGDDTDQNLAVGTGTVSFDTSGQPIDDLPVAVTIDRDGTGALSPLTFNLAFADAENRVTALTSTDSNIAATFRDGAPEGTLVDFGVGPDGVIAGAFDNGLTRTIGQVALATFSNPEGLVDVGSNLFSVGPNSGQAVVTDAGTFGAGTIVGGALETSNVDLGEEFIELILASTGYSASSRVIRTADELIQQLLVLGR